MQGLMYHAKIIHPSNVIAMEQGPENNQNQTKKLFITNLWHCKLKVCLMKYSSKLLDQLLKVLEQTKSLAKKGTNIPQYLKLSL